MKQLKKRKGDEKPEMQRIKSVSLSVSQKKRKGSEYVRHLKLSACHEDCCRCAFDNKVQDVAKIEACLFQLKKEMCIIESKLHLSMRWHKYPRWMMIPPTEHGLHVNQPSLRYWHDSVKRVRPLPDEASACRPPVTSPSDALEGNWLVLWSNGFGFHLEFRGLQAEVIVRTATFYGRRSRALQRPWDHKESSIQAWYHAFANLQAEQRLSFCQSSRSIPLQS